MIDGLRLFAAIAVVGGVVSAGAAVIAQTGANVPRFEVDPSWPKALPNKWLMGQAAGVSVDRHDHIWVVQRPKSLTEDERGATLTPPRNECCAPAPPVMEFDAEGNLLRAWGGPAQGHPWPENEHGITVDAQDNVWLSGNGPKDGMLLKFTSGGKHLLTIGQPGIVGDDRDTSRLNRPSNTAVDVAAGEVYVADGYGNHRVIVVDMQTGAYKRHWGASGRPPGDASVKAFNNVHCVRLSRDGLVYVCDRGNNRLQVFKKDGTFVKEFALAPETRGAGSTWDVDLSVDAGQSVLYTADGENNKVWALLRDSGQILGHFGRSGRQAGQFHWVHNMAVDSTGSIYTTEVDSGKRAQRFVAR